MVGHLIAAVATCELSLGYRATAYAWGPTRVLRSILHGLILLAELPVSQRCMTAHGSLNTRHATVAMIRNVV